MRWIHDALRDVVYATRTLGRTRGFTATAVITLALGIGAVTIIYSVVRNVLLEPFPYTDSRRMVDVVVRDASNRILRGALPAPEFLDYQEQSQAFEDVAGTVTETVQWVSEGGAERLVIGWVTPNTFEFLGVRPLLGRPVGPADAAPGAPRVAALNHRTWLRLFGGDHAVLGRTLNLNGDMRTIVAVMPPRFEWHVADLWLPDTLSRSDDPKQAKSARWFQARLRRGLPIEEAQAQMNVLASRRAKEFPAQYPERSRIQVITVIDWVVGQFRAVLYTLFGAVSLLLVIACCNVANMLLARGTTREREIAVRAALGASRSRIVRQLLVESALLAAGGAAAGTLLAYAGIAALARYMPRQGVPWETQIRLDLPVLLFALAASVLATFVFGLFPALSSVRRELVAGANTGGRSGTAGRRHTRMRNGLVVAEITLSMILLLGAGLLVRTFVKLAAVDIGIDTKNLLIAPVSFVPNQFASAAAQRQFYQEALDRVRSLPGVLSASVTSSPPPFGGLRTEFAVPGAGVVPPAPGFVVFANESFLETLGIAVIRGRALSRDDVDQARRVGVVNASFAKYYFGTGDPLGRQVRVNRLATGPAPVADPTFQIVGVVPDTANQGLRDPSAPQVYVPFPVRGPIGLLFLVRTAGDPMAVAAGVRREIQTVDRRVAVNESISLEDVLQRSFFAQPRFTLIVLVMFAATGLVLVALGVYGVLAYTVSQRSREIAIRVALGGERRHVLGHIVGMGVRLLGAGVFAGLAIGFATNRLLASQLWQTSPHDPLTLAAVTVLVVAIGLCACWVPARRALGVQPIAALRHE